jgi:predicted Zn-dependent protease
VTALPARVLLLAGSLACVAWLAAGLGPVRDQAAAIALVSGPRAPSPTAVDRAERLLSRAAAATRSREPDLRRAQLLLLAGRAAAAVRVALGVVRDEPANAEAWMVLARAAAAGDPALAARARARLRALIRQVPAAH